jgi:hypothetical protein
MSNFISPTAIVIRPSLPGNQNPKLARRALADEYQTFFSTGAKLKRTHPNAANQRKISVKNASYHTVIIDFLKFIGLYFCATVLR